MQGIRRLDLAEALISYAFTTYKTLDAKTAGVTSFRSFTAELKLAPSSEIDPGRSEIDYFLCSHKFPSLIHTSWMVE